MSKLRGARLLLWAISNRHLLHAFVNASQKDAGRTKVMDVDAPYIYVRHVLWAQGDVSALLRRFGGDDK